MSAPADHVVFVPIDDGLIAGPFNGLAELAHLLGDIAAAQPDAVMAFPGPLRNFSTTLIRTPTILNLTASTNLSEHTHKRQIASVEDAFALGADAVAVHVNMSSRHEGELLQVLGSTARACDTIGMPLMALMYLRREGVSGADDNYEEVQRNEPERYAKLVAHACRVGAELGADIIKTQYTGSVESFRNVVGACAPVPVVIAGGPIAPAREVFERAIGAAKAGALGVSFGRNVFSRRNPSRWIEALRIILSSPGDLDAALAHVNGEP